MSEKEQWGNAYTDMKTTYVEFPRNPIDLEQKWNYQIIHKLIAEYLKGLNNPKIIEVGCGGARNGLYLALQGFDVTCSDYSYEAIRLARANIEAFNVNGTFLLDDLMNTTISENTYDCVMSFGLLEHFSELKPIINVLTRILKPGGIHIHLVIPKKFSTQTIMNVLLFPGKLFNNLVVRRQPFKGILRKSYRNFPHYENSFSWREYCKAFEESGNKVLRCEPGGLIIPFTYWTSFVGLGKITVKLFQKPIIRINEIIRNSTFDVVYYLSQTFTVICKKE